MRGWHLSVGIRGQLYAVSASQPFADELALAQSAARAAAAVIRSIGPHQVVCKADGSPVTAADLQANSAIVDLIRSRFPQDGLLSEESLDTSARLGCRRVWIIDPLDGTRDFVEGTGQYAVHVGLAIDGCATVGVVAEPATERLTWAVRGQGAFAQDSAGSINRLQVSSEARLSAFAVGTSRLAMSANVQDFIDAAPPLLRVAMGASTKVLAVARGALHAAVWLSAVEKEWDTCAPSVIVQEAGGMMTDVFGDALTYNNADVVHRRGLLASNGSAHQDLVVRAKRFFP